MRLPIGVDLTKEDAPALKGFGSERLHTWANPFDTPGRPQLGLPLPASMFQSPFHLPTALPPSALQSPVLMDGRRPLDPLCPEDAPSPSGDRRKDRAPQPSHRAPLLAIETPSDSAPPAAATRARAADVVVRRSLFAAEAEGGGRGRPRRGASPPLAPYPVDALSLEDSRRHLGLGGSVLVRIRAPPERQETILRQIVAPAAAPAPPLPPAFRAPESSDAASGPRGALVDGCSPSESPDPTPGRRGGKRARAADAAREAPARETPAKSAKKGSRLARPSLPAPAPAHESPPADRPTTAPHPHPNPPPGGSEAARAGGPFLRLVPQVEGPVVHRDVHGSLVRLTVGTRGGQGRR